MIAVKNAEVLNELLAHRYHEKLIRLLVWLYASQPDWEIIITSGRRIGDPGVHGTDPCRAVDLRSSIFPDPALVEAQINEAWEYDPERPEMRCCLLHDSGQGMHLHVQVHNNTRRRNV